MEDSNVNAKDECVEALNFVIGKFGYALVASTLHDRMKQDYSFMKKYFEDKKVKTEKEPKVKAVVEPEVVEAVVVEPLEAEVEPEVEEVKVRTPKEIKEWQKGEEDKKRKEQEAKGIKPKDLLTKENLQKWYGEEGRTFAYIARTYVGCKDTEVSSAVKLFGIETTRKNVMVYKKK